MKRIILTNQHADNRGDEAATIGEIKSLRYYFGQDAEISVYIQSGTQHKFLPEEYNVTEKDMIISPFGLIEMILWIIFKLIKIDLRIICSSRLKRFIVDHESVDIVISSCAGPYIGDIYINHEFIHIMHLAVPVLLGTKTVFFAVSMGPFRNKFMNFFRRKILTRMGLLILRDEISFDFVKEFLPYYKNVYLTTDACLADELNIKSIVRKPNVIGFTPMDYKYPLSDNKAKSKLNYEQATIGTLDTLMEQNPELKVEFFPHLYAKHSDIPFIDKLISQMKFPERSIIFSDQLSGRDQQFEIASLDYVIATRHHSAIFACKTFTPVVCIVYEHKAQAFMDSVNLGEYCVDIYTFDKHQMLDKISLMRENQQAIREMLPERINELTPLAYKSAELIYNYYLLENEG